MPEHLIRTLRCQHLLRKFVLANHTPTVATFVIQNRWQKLTLMTNNVFFSANFLQIKKGNNMKMLKTPYFNSGEERIRTVDLLTASQAL